MKLVTNNNNRTYNTYSFVDVRDSRGNFKPLQCLLNIGSILGSISSFIAHHTKNKIAFKKNHIVNEEGIYSTKSQANKG